MFSGSAQARTSARETPGPTVYFRGHGEVAGWERVPEPPTAWPSWSWREPAGLLGQPPLLPPSSPLPGLTVNTETWPFGLEPSRSGRCPGHLGGGGWGRGRGGLLPPLSVGVTLLTQPCSWFELNPFPWNLRCCYSLSPPHLLLGSPPPRPPPPKAHFQQPAISSGLLSSPNALSLPHAPLP